MRRELIISSLLIFISTGCSLNPDIEVLETKVSTLKDSVQLLENKIDSILWQQQILVDVNSSYDELLMKQGIDASYLIQVDSSIVIEIIEIEDLEIDY